MQTDATKFKIRTNLSARLIKSDGEKNTLPSLTVPDQSLTIRQIMERYARGLPLEGQRVPIYEGEDEDNYLPDPRTLDLSEREDLAAQANEELHEIKRKHKKPQTNVDKTPPAPTVPDGGTDDVDEKP